MRRNQSSQLHLHLLHDAQSLVCHQNVFFPEPPFLHRDQERPRWEAWLVKNTSEARQRQIRRHLCQCPTACGQATEDVAPVHFRQSRGKGTCLFGLKDKKEAAPVTQAPVVPPLRSGLLWKALSIFPLEEGLEWMR